MRVSVTYLLLLSAMIGPVLQLLGTTPEIKFWLEPSTCRPGDLVRLHAQMESPHYAEFNLKIPRNNALYRVTQNQQPITYEQGVYRQQSTWVLQPMQPGNIELGRIIAEIQIGSQTTEQELSSPTLIVVAYPEPTDSMAPLLLETASDTPGISFNLIGSISTAIALLWITGRLWRTTRKSEVTPTTSPTATTLADLEAALQADHIPQALIETLLLDPELKLSIPTRNALERAAYGPADASTIEALRSCLRKESQA